MKIISKRDLFISNTGGSAVRIKANTPRDMSDEIGLLALQQGAEQYHEAVHGVKSTPVPAEVPHNVAEVELIALSPAEECAAAIERIVAEGIPDNMTVGGRVKAQALNEALGRQTTPEEREEAWTIYITR